MHAYLRPVVISIAPLKLPIFQQDNAARSKHPNAAFCSCGVGWDIIKYVTHEHTCTVNDVKQLQFFLKHKLRTEYSEQMVFQFAINRRIKI